MNTTPVTLGWRFWLKWTLATYFGIVVGTLSGMLAPFVILLSMDGGSNLLDSLAVIAYGLLVVSVISLWIVVGVAQWSILRRFIDQRVVTWVGATVLGALPIAVIEIIMGASTSTPIPDNVMGILRLVLLFASGAILGTTQWWVLRKKVDRAALWIVISLISWSIAGLVTRLINRWMGNGSEILALLLFSTLSVFCGTILSTLGLWWFLKKTTSTAELKAPEGNVVHP